METSLDTKPVKPAPEGALNTMSASVKAVAKRTKKPVAEANAPDNIELAQTVKQNSVPTVIIKKHVPKFDRVQALVEAKNTVGVNVAPEAVRSPLPKTGDESRRRALKASRSGADNVVTVEESRQVMHGTVPRVGEAVQFVHTKQAYRIFMGREADETKPGHKAARIYSAKYACGALSRLHSLSVRGNPFADLALIKIERKFEEIRLELEGYIEKSKNKLTVLENETGITYTMASSIGKLEIPVRVGTVYGHKVLQLLGVYDRVIRYLFTLKEVGVIIKNEQEKAISIAGRSFRGSFEMVAYYLRLLDIEAHAAINRDSLNSASVETQRVVRELLDRFDGSEFTQKVLAGEIRPTGVNPRKEQQVKVD